MLEEINNSFSPTTEIAITDVDAMRKTRRCTDGKRGIGNAWFLEVGRTARIAGETRRHQ
jgi:hypothetical protein